ncbi:helix-turn-helix domain-containing protein [Candidatus Odyssella acanthamoebae]|uniref:helix-turn-helix domain-containing protein n=1 Tax=Candidatus Odyssella acanthamoebae TaxID=91604 RepID=UPI00068CC929|nr:winged helix-turn-helix domain-containing protein [Candidatus Paracaedibacter acanthamoebae]
MRRKIVEAVVVNKNSQKGVAQMYGFTEATVSHYVRAYKNEGNAGLTYKKRGRRLQSCTKLCLENEEKVRDVIEHHTPDQVGLECVLWTRKAVRQYISDTYGITYSVRDMGDVLKRWGFTPQKPMKVAILIWFSIGLRSITQPFKRKLSKKKPPYIGQMKWD